MRSSDWSSDVCSSDLAWGGGVVFGDLALAVHRIDAQPDVERPAPRAKLIEERTKARDLSRRVEDQMVGQRRDLGRSEEHTSELQSLMRISYAVFCLKKKTNINHKITIP